MTLKDHLAKKSYWDTHHDIKYSRISHLMYRIVFQVNTGFLNWWIFNCKYEYPKLHFYIKEKVQILLFRKTWKASNTLRAVIAISPLSMGDLTFYMD